MGTDSDEERSQAERVAELAAVIAHELKAPIAGVAALLGTLARGSLAGELRAALEAARHRLLDLDAMVDDLMLCARPLEPQLGPVLLGDALDAAIGQVRGRAGVSIQVAPGPSSILVRGDPRLLVRLFRNLILSAAASMESGLIRFSASARERHCQIEVSDTGPGIPTELRERVFEPRFSRRPHGTGLGLAAARRIVEAHQGTISARFPARGCVITVTLPLHAGALFDG